ncbi:hypothetical protein ABZ845_24025 [Streptomyces sp. NPDC047022]|uniref:allene oxide cyclase barrel-like domain-containing protein n=1 Tax=Streptomyces sp. NPDC047022 TaxID=3155737 RepID=UPI0034041DF4
MRRIKRLGLSVATGLAAALCCAPLASAAAPTVAGPPLTRDRGEVIHLTSVVTQVTGIDQPPPGPSQGDELIVAGDLSHGSFQVGTFDETLTTTRLNMDGSITVQAVITLTLPGGNITAQGVFIIGGSGPTDVTLAITGGTGVYSTARGYIHAVNTSATTSQVFIHLIR